MKEKINLKDYLVNVNVPEGKTGTAMEKNVREGKLAEKIFINDYLSTSKIDYVDVTKDKCYRKIGIDFVSGDISWDVKTFKNEEIYIEENTNDGILTGEKKKGWWYSTQAKFLAFVNVNTREIIFLERTDEFVNLYNNNKWIWELLWKTNAISFDKKGNSWRSDFLVLPLSRITGYYTSFKYEG